MKADRQWGNMNGPIRWHRKRRLDCNGDFELWPGFVESMALPEVRPSGHTQETSRFRMDSKRKEVQLIEVIPICEWMVMWLLDSSNWVREEHYLVVRQSPLGEARTLFRCQTVPIGHDKYVICWVSLFVNMLAPAVDTLGAVESASSCKAFHFWLCNLRVSERGGSEPGRRSGMPGEYTWITASGEVCSGGGGGGVRDILTLGATIFDNQLASAKVVWMIFLRVGVCIGLLGVTVEGMTDGVWDRPQVLEGCAGSSSGSCGRWVSTWKPWMTATGVPRHEGSARWRGLALPWANWFKSGLLNIPLPLHIY